MSDPSPTHASGPAPSPDGGGTAGSFITAAAATMYAADAASRALGISLVEAGEGTATVQLEVQEHHVNGLGVCHGGIVFTLADTAMAFASNAGGEQALAAQASIDWLAPALAGRTLTATASPTVQQGRTAIHDVTVVDDAGVTVAVFRGRTRARGGNSPR